MQGAFDGRALWPVFDSYLQAMLVLDEVIEIWVSCSYGIVQRQLLELYDGDHREIQGALD